LFAMLSLSLPLAAPVPVQVRPALDTIVFQQGVSPSADYAGASDTFISHLGDENVNYGSQAILALHSSDQRALLMRFELAGLSAGDHVDQAILSLYVSDHPTGTAALPVSVYRVLVRR
jgi:hypothetical protein